MKISVVMPSLNQSRYVEEALRSVIEQSYDDKEILFIDGGSTDNTINIVKKYREHLSYCVSEPDGGQSDALIKGFSRATGEILTWLNTDDLLLPGALEQAAGSLAGAGGCSWAFGNVVWISAEGRILRCWRGEGYTRVAGPKHGIMASGGPSAFFTRELYERVGGINRELRYQMDTELWWRFAMSGETYHRLEGYIWGLRLHAEAKVSGQMFHDKSDAKQLQIASEKQIEAEHISRLTAGYRVKVPAILGNAAKIARRLSSPAYLRGRLDDCVWRGRDINELTEALCKNGP